MKSLNNSPLLGYAPRWLVSSITGADITTLNQRSGTSNRRDANWIDGLRGLAALAVLIGHLNCGWSMHLLNPAPSDHASPYLFQYPILRLVMAGRGAVSTFFIITGYVNSLSAIKSFRAGNATPSLLNMAKRSFNRIGRLYLPTALAVTLSWFCWLMGFYRIGTRVDSQWYRDSSTKDVSTVGQSLYHLWDDLTIFWYTSKSYFDPYHWTMAYIMTASFRVYMVLLVLAMLKRSWGYVVTAVLYFFAWRTRDYFIGLNVTVGILLAQLHVDLAPRATNLLPKPIPCLMILFGLVIWSYPLEHPEWLWWSRSMSQFMKRIGPQDQETISRFWTSIGPAIVMLGITFSPNARKILAHPVFNFLGRCSYAIYLLHHTMIRAILLPMLYGYAYLTTPERDDKGNIILLKAPPKIVFFFVMPLFHIILFCTAHLWTEYVDTYCGKLVGRVKDAISREDGIPGEKNGILPLNGVVIGAK